MGIKLGSEMKLYYCTDGIGGSPSWQELDIIKDVKLDMPKEKIPIKTRAGGGRTVSIGGFIDVNAAFEMIWDTEDPGLQALKDSFLNRTAIGLAIMDGDIETPGTEGIQADCEVFKFDRAEPLDKEATVAVEAAPTYSDNAWNWVVVGG